MASSENPGATCACRPKAWVIPLVYAMCAGILLLDQWEGVRRSRLAKDVGTALAGHLPQTLAELEQELGSSFAKLERHGANERRKTPWARVYLKPQVGLHLDVIYQVPGDVVESVKLIFGLSDELLLQDARRGIPRLPAARNTALAVFAGCFMSLVWLRAACTAYSWRSFVGAALACIFLPPYVLGAVLSLWRVSW